MEKETTIKKDALGVDLVCLAGTLAAFWVMKKISESARGNKLSWKEFLLPKR